MASILNEELMDTNLDIPEGEIKIVGAADPVYADAIRVHSKKKKETEQALKDKKPELKKPFLGTKGKTTVVPNSKELKKLRLAEDMFRSIRESATGENQELFDVIDDIEKTIEFISNMTDEQVTYEEMMSAYEDLEGFLKRFKQCVDTMNKNTVTEATAIDWARRDLAYNKDTWSCIYNELNGDVRAQDARFRRFEIGAGERYGDANLSIDGEAIIVNVHNEADLDFAKQVADEYGVEFEVREHTSIYAPYRFSIKIYTNRPVSVTEELDGAPNDKEEMLYCVMDDEDWIMDSFDTEEEAIAYAKEQGFPTVQIVYQTELDDGEIDVSRGDVVWWDDSEEEDHTDW